MTLNSYEAFYYLGVYGSVTEASHHIPSSNTPSAVSMHITALEEHYGTPLYIRRPFALTPMGQKVFDLCQKFIEGLAHLEKERLAHKETLNIGGPEVVLQHYLDDEINLVRQQFPTTQLNLRDGDQASLEEALLRHEMNVAVTIFDKKPAKNLRSCPLLQLPLALVVPAKSKWKSAADVLESLKVGIVCQTVRDLSGSAVRNSSAAGKIFGRSESHGAVAGQGQLGDPSLPVLMLPAKHAITQNFRDGLKQRGIKDFAISEYDTTSLIENCVRKGHGIGVSVMAPGMDASPLRGEESKTGSKKNGTPLILTSPQRGEESKMKSEKMKGLRFLPLSSKEFAMVTLGLLWREPASPALTAFIEAVKAKAKRV